MESLPWFAWHSAVVSQGSGSPRKQHSHWLVKMLQTAPNGAQRSLSTHGAESGPSVHVPPPPVPPCPPDPLLVEVPVPDPPAPPAPAPPPAPTPAVPVVTPEDVALALLTEALPPPLPPGPVCSPTGTSLLHAGNISRQHAANARPGRRKLESEAFAARTSTTRWFWRSQKLEEERIIVISISAPRMPRRHGVDGRSEVYF
jgi:hypothetical protein